MFFIVILLFSLCSYILSVLHLPFSSLVLKLHYCLVLYCPFSSFIKILSLVSLIIIIFQFLSIPSHTVPFNVNFAFCCVFSPVCCLTTTGPPGYPIQRVPVPLPPPPASTPARVWSVGCGVEGGGREGRGGEEEEQQTAKRKIKRN